MLRKIKVTRRDVLLLKDIYENSFLSFYQIHEAHFTGRARPTVYNRLSKMAQAELIEALNVNLFVHHRNNESVGVIYRVTKRGVELLNNFTQGVPISSTISGLNLSSLYHDLLLTDVLRAFKKRLPTYSIVSSKSNSCAWNKKERIPDAVLFNPEDKIKLALELELTAKSEERYRDIILSYRTSPEFEKVFYVVKDESIQQKMGGLITGYKGQYTEGDDTDKFVFYGLANLINNQQQEKINELQN